MSADLSQGESYEEQQGNGGQQQVILKTARNHCIGFLEGSERETKLILVPSCTKTVKESTNHTK